MKMCIHEMDGVREIIEGGTGGKNGGACRKKKPVVQGRLRVRTRRERSRVMHRIINSRSWDMVKTNKKCVVGRDRRNRTGV